MYAHAEFPVSSNPEPMNKQRETPKHKHAMHEEDPCTLMLAPTSVLLLYIGLVHKTQVTQSTRYMDVTTRYINYIVCVF